MNMQTFEVEYEHSAMCGTATKRVNAEELITFLLNKDMELIKIKVI